MSEPLPFSLVAQMDNLAIYFDRLEISHTMVCLLTLEFPLKILEVHNNALRLELKIVQLWFEV